MSTNYYVRDRYCDCCGRFDVTHIGKKSAGWEFVFQSDPENDITSWQDWKKRLTNSYIFDEYDRRIEYYDFVTNIVEPSLNTDNKNHFDEMSKTDPTFWRNNWKDDEGYAISNVEFS